MSRGQMRNLDTFKIGNSQVNEFEYQKNQGQLTEQLEQHPDESGKGQKRLTQAERVKQIMADAHKKVEKKRKKARAGNSGKSGSGKVAAKAKKSGKAASSKTSEKSGKKSAKI